MFKPIAAFVTVDADGNKVRVDPSQLFAAGDPIIAGRESLFEPVDPTVEDAAGVGDVETADARPARKRATKKRATKKRATKKT